MTNSWPLLDPLAHVVAHSPAETQSYLGSPSIVRLPDRSLIVTHDFFGPGSPKDAEGREYLTHVYRSTDDGESWERIAAVPAIYWSTLFFHRGALYLLGCSGENGSICIRRSQDGGRTWTQAVDERSGLLFAGGSRWENPNYHGSSVPVLFAGGRLWRGFEDCNNRDWPAGFQAFVISAPEDADLLDARQWRMSNKLAYDQESDPPAYGGSGKSGWLEGNVVLGPDGTMWDILRVHSCTPEGHAAMARLDPQTHTLSFDPATGFIDFPGGMTKFNIRFDSDSRRYWTLANNVTNPKNPSQRNVLSLYSSADLRNWRHERTLLVDEEDWSKLDWNSKVGFQYVDWQFDGDDLISAVRTAYRGAHNFHDSNYIVFQRIRNFRQVRP